MTAMMSSFRVTGLCRDRLGLIPHRLLPDMGADK